MVWNLILRDRFLLPLWHRGFGRFTRFEVDSTVIILGVSLVRFRACGDFAMSAITTLKIPPTLAPRNLQQDMLRFNKSTVPLDQTSTPGEVPRALRSTRSTRDTDSLTDSTLFQPLSASQAQMLAVESNDTYIWGILDGKPTNGHGRSAAGRLDFVI